MRRRPVDRRRRLRRPSAGSVAAGLVAGLLLAAGCGGGEPDAPGPDEADRGEAALASTAPRPAERLLERGAVDNVVLITVDTLRADVLGFSRGERPKAETPVLDRLAAAGRVYRRAHAHSVVTLPSHANILTGLYPYQHGIRENSGFVLRESLPTAASVLSAEGFATAAFVGAYPLDARYGLDRGFDVYDDRYPEGRATDFDMPERPGSEVVPAAVEWWRAHSGERRFLWVHLYDPHTPYAPPEPFASRYDDPYLGEVAATDAHLAPLLEPFLGGGEEPTLIVFTSDHGEALGDHGELTHGFFAYQPTLRVPLVLWAPGLPAGESEAWVRHVDLLPTVLEAVGEPLPENLPGRSLLLEPAEPTAPPSYFEALSPALNRGWAPLRGMIEDGYKFISVPLPELYDLEADPGETTNLLQEEKRRTRELAALLPEESEWPPRRSAYTVEEEERLRALGYLGGTAAAKERYTAEDDPKNLVHLDRKLHQVIDLFHRRELEEAETLAREVIEARPEMGLGYTCLAQVLLERGETSEAIAVMSEARRRGAASPSLTRQLGLSLAESGRYQEALEILGPLSPGGDPDVLNALGLVLSEAGEQGEAREVLERVFAADPRNPVAHQHLALVALRRSRWEEARDQARRALELNEELTLAWNYLATAQYNLGKRRDAVDSLDRAVSADPQNWDALYNLAVIALEIGDFDRARAALDRFIAEAPAERYAPDLAQAREWRRRLG